VNAALKPLGVLPTGLGARLRSLRNQKGWTLEQLSLSTNLSEPYLRRIESGRRQTSLAALMTLASAHSLPLASPLEEAPVLASLRVVIQAVKLRQSIPLRAHSIVWRLVQ
jgi:transcriptional regulator with XRE-family HTH domain